MLFIKVDNGIPVEWPIQEFQTKSHLKKLNISPPKVIGKELAAEYGFAEYQETDRPNFDSLLENPPTETTPIEIDGIWYQQWQVTQKYITEQERLDLLHQDFLQQGREKIEQVNSLYSEKLYTNVSAMFPDGEKVIQFRSEQDRTNLSNVASAGLALIISGTPEASMVWRTEDNVNQIVPAQQMVGIAMGVLQEKQAILSAAWAHKDAITAIVDAGDLQGLIDYDITTGWPV